MKNFISTRGGQAPLDFIHAIVQGIGCDGGLLVPDRLPEPLDFHELINLDYIQLATRVISAFVPDDMKDLVHEACARAYGDGAFPTEVVPVVKAGDIFIAELFHGRTAAFKDMALSILPHFMTLSLERLHEDRKVMILAATSGDTGKAALEGFRDVPGTSIMVFYPTDGVSAVQKRQMVTQEGGNVRVIGIRGNFDDAQRAVKNAFADPAIKKECDAHGIFLSSANSINIGRLLPQVVYYISSYLELVRRGEVALGGKVNFCVPSGNFGNCLAGWIAMKLGVPVGKFIIASNRNNILTDFFRTGRYDTRREFYKTNAPAMDILVSSNLERLLWFMSGGSDETARCMKELGAAGFYDVSEDLMAGIRGLFYAGYAGEDEVIASIRECYGKDAYMLDTHTACGYHTVRGYRAETGDDTPVILMSTASPYKFPEAVCSAICGEVPDDVFTAIGELNRVTSVPVPAPLDGLRDRKTLHSEVIDKTEIPGVIVDAIKKNRQ